MRARRATAGAVRARCAHAPNVCCSDAVNTNGAFGRQVPSAPPVSEVRFGPETYLQNFRDRRLVPCISDSHHKSAGMRGDGAVGDRAMLARMSSADLVPDQGLRVCIVDVKKLADGALQGRHTAVRAAAQLFVRQCGEPALDEVEPRRVGRREVQMETRAFGQPPVNQGRLVRAVVVEDEVHVEVGPLDL